jgi:hypothetical protein
MRNELPEESDQFRFLHATFLDNLKVSWVIFDGIIGHEDFYTA